MKLLIYFIVLVVSCSCSLGQNNNSKAKDYFDTFKEVKIKSESFQIELLNNKQFVVEKLTPLDIKILALEKYISSLSLKDFLDIVDKRNKVYEQDPYLIAEFQIQHDEEIDKKLYKDSIRFGIYEGIINRRLENIYGKTLGQLAISPILIRAKIKNQKIESYKVMDDFYLELKIIVAEIEDWIKDNSLISKGKSIQFFYAPFWTGSNIKFTNNESYFFSLLPIIDNKSGKKRLALNVNEVNGGLIKIFDSKLIDSNNYYGFGILPWEEFKNKICALFKINKCKEK